jgi:hypothetical protein
MSVWFAAKFTAFVGEGLQCVKYFRRRQFLPPSRQGKAQTLSNFVTHRSTLIYRYIIYNETASQIYNHLGASCYLKYLPSGSIEDNLLSRVGGYA